MFLCVKMLFLFALIKYFFYSCACACVRSLYREVFFTFFKYFFVYSCLYLFFIYICTNKKTINQNLKFYYYANFYNYNRKKQNKQIYFN